MSQIAICELCGELMPDGEEMFKFHGYSGPCPKPPLPPMKKAGIAIDDWKLDTFKRCLTSAGYSFEVASGVTADTLFLFVMTRDLAALAEVVKAANAEAARSKP